MRQCEVIRIYALHCHDDVINLECITEKAYLRHEVLLRLLLLDILLLFQSDSTFLLSHLRLKGIDIYCDHLVVGCDISVQALTFLERILLVVRGLLPKELLGFLNN